MDELNEKLEEALYERDHLQLEVDQIKQTVLLKDKELLNRKDQIYQMDLLSR